LFRAYDVLVEVIFFGGVSGGELEVFDEVLDEGGEEHGGYVSWNGLVEVFVWFQVECTICVCEQLRIRLLPPSFGIILKNAS